MPLIVEDGTGLSNANVYISLNDANAYHLERNNIAWASLSDAQKNAALLYATQYLDATYSWRGSVVDEDQALGMPTEDGVDDQGRDIEGLPARIGYACAEVALIHSTKPLTAVLGPRVIEQEVTGAVRRKFADSASNEGYRYPGVDMLLKGLHSGRNINFLESMAS